MTNDNKKTGPSGTSPETIAINEDAMKKCAELEKLGSVPYAKDIAQAHREGKIDYDVLFEIYDVLKNPNLMAKVSYKHFAKALSQGKFPNRSKFAPTFLRSLKGGEEERNYAETLLRNLNSEASHLSRALTPRTEKAHLKNLAELREKDIAASTLTFTASAANAIIDSSDLNSRIKAAGETKKENWVLERAPAELVEKLDSLEHAQFTLSKEANQKDKELQRLLTASKPDEAAIKRLKEELSKIDHEIEALLQERVPVHKEWIDYFSRTLARYRAIEYFSRRAGFDVNATEDLKIWLFDIASGKKDTRPKTLKMTGLEADPTTGKTKKVLKEIKISRLIFEREKEDIYDYSPGELTVEYYDDEGKLVQSGYQNFMHLMDAFEAYEEINSLAELNEKVAPETGYKDLHKGQQFKAKIYVGMDDKGKKIYQEESFSIQEKNEITKEIILDKFVTKIPKEWISSSVDPALRFSRKQKVFSYGEFAKLLRQHDFHSEMSIDELNEALGKQNTASEKQAMSLVQGQSPELQDRFKKIGGTRMSVLSIPKSGETTKVWYLDDDGSRQAGILRRTIDESGKENLIIEPDPNDPNNPDLESMINAGVPFALATKMPGLKPKIGSDAWKKRVRKMDAVAAMDAANKGSIIDRTQPAPEPTAAPSEAMPSFESMVAENSTPEPEPEPEPQGTAPKKVKYNTEVLPYNDIHKVGNMTKAEQGMLSSIWNSTRFLSVSDFWEMGKVMWEYYERRFQRRQKDRYSSVASDVYYFAPEMKRINQSTETESMQQFKDSFDAKGVFEIQDRLTTTTNRDELKACMYTLMEKGQIPWYNVDLWKNLNNFIDIVNPSVRIPIPADGDPFTQIAEDDPRTGKDFLKAGIDVLFGEGQYNEWYSGDKSKYQSNARTYYEEGKELEGTDGGHEQRLGELLRQHKNGEYVDPQEYEGLILHSIENGKSSMQAKIYFMVEGVAAVCSKNGRTILPPDRIAHINSEMLPRFPILEYMTARMKRDNGKVARPTQQDYKKWADIFDDGNSSDPTKHTPKGAVDRFMWKYVIPSDQTRTRINKAIRNGENLDHDDMFAYLPPATEEVLNDACKATSGSKKFLTIEGYANVFPGFSQYMRTLADDDKRERLVEALRSYVRFEGIMTDKYEKGKDKYQRMSDNVLNASKGTVCTPGRPPQVFINGMNEVVDRVVEAYNDTDLNSLYETMHINAAETDHRAQERIKLAFDTFGRTLQKVVKGDNGAKMVQIVRAANLEGMPEGVSNAEKEARKRAFTSENEM